VCPTRFTFPRSMRSRLGSGEVGREGAQPWQDGLEVFAAEERAARVHGAALPELVVRRSTRIARLSVPAMGHQLLMTRSATRPFAPKPQDQGPLSAGHWTLGMGPIGPTHGGLRPWMLARRFRAPWRVGRPELEVSFSGRSRPHWRRCSR
jgi:hypothetical protein